MMRSARKLLHDQSGATLVEMALLIGLIAIGCFVGFHNLSDAMVNAFKTVSKFLT